jgi:large subunit ribosomal protein L3
MHKGLLGRKFGMSSLFSPEGEHVPVTVLQVGPCVITQIKTRATDGYDGLQLGFLEKKPSRVSKPLQGHFRKSGGQGYTALAEIAVDDPSKYSLGQTLTADVMFQVGDLVDVTGFSKGRGFTGVIKRWGFHGGKASHGSMFHRAPGSIGSSAWPSRVIKGHKLPGRHGNRRVTVRNLKVVDIRPEQGLMIVKGAVPGSTNGLLEVQKPKIVRKR